MGEHHDFVWEIHSHVCFDDCKIINQVLDDCKGKSLGLKIVQIRE